MTVDVKMTHTEYFIVADLYSINFFFTVQTENDLH